MAKFHKLQFRDDVVFTNDGWDFASPTILKYKRQN